MPNKNNPWNGPTNFFSSIRKTPDQPLIWTKNNRAHVFGQFFFNGYFPKIHFKICSYIQKIIRNLIKAIKITIFIIQTHQQQPNIFPTIHFSKRYMRFGLPMRPWTTFELTNSFAYVKNMPDTTTLMLHALK